MELYGFQMDDDDGDASESDDDDDDDDKPAAAAGGGGAGRRGGGAGRRMFEVRTRDQSESEIQSEPATRSAGPAAACSRCAAAALLVVEAAVLRRCAGSVAAKGAIELCSASQHRRTAP